MIAGIILAAGESRRMGANKALLAFGQSTVIETVIQAHLVAGVEPLVVVLGHEHTQVAATISHLPVHPAINENYREGMFTSVVTGVKALADIASPSGVLFSLVDQPSIPASVIRQLKDAFQEEEGKIVLPVFGRKNGHPIVFPWQIARDIEHFSGEGGLRGYRDRHAELLLRIPCNSEAVVRDMDTKRDYSREVSEFPRKEKEE